MKTFANLFITCCIVVSLIGIGISDAAQAANEPNGSVDPNNLQDALEQAMRDLRQQGKAIPKEEIIEKYGSKVIAAVEPYFQDSNRNVRIHAYMLTWIAGRQSKDSSVRRKAVDSLLRNCLKDTELKRSIFDRLLFEPFRATDYSPFARKLLHAELTSSPGPRIILLTGAADMKSELPELKKFVEDVNEPLQIYGYGRMKSHSLAFAALMARARMGVKPDIRRCIDLVESYPDERIKILRLLKRLSYVRQPEVVDYIKKYFFMDEIEPGPKAEVSMTYADRALIALSQMLVDFPKGKSSDFKTHQEYIDFNRQWLSQQTKYEIIK